MSAREVATEDYLQFLLATPERATCTEAKKTLKTQKNDAYHRLSDHQPANTEALWEEASEFLRRLEGVWVLDDIVLRKTNS